MKTPSPRAPASPLSRLAARILAGIPRLARCARLAWPALLAGALGSMAATLVMGILRLAWGTLTPPELLAERVLPLMSAGDFVAFLIRFAPHPKTTPLGLTLLGQFALGVLIAPALQLAARPPTRATARRWPTRRGWLAAGAVALLMEIAAVALFWPALPAGIYGRPLGQARALTILSLALTFATYAAVTLLALHLFLRLLAPRASATTGPAAPPAGLTRRGALQATGLTVIGLAAGGLALQQLITAYLARSNLSYEGMETPGAPPTPITPNDQFYVVSKNVLDPTVDASLWRLEVTGLVERPLSLTLAELAALPAERRAVTLECIANGVGGHLISTALWEGPSLQTLLDRAHVRPDGTRVVFHSVDGYITSLALRDLLDARTLLAYRMNGEPLPQRHGFPLRAVVPGRYGEQSAKWVTRIEITDHDVKGFYQSQGWSAAPLETTSRVDVPGRRVAFGTVNVAGIAFAGTRGISRVEVSADGGATWSAAALRPPLSGQSWVFWSWPWHPPSRGVYTLVVRATDGLGQVQTPIMRGTVPDGSTGWHRVVVTVQ